MLPDVLKPALKIIFCGTAVGEKSANVGAYYSGNGNKFWKIIYRVGLTPLLLNPKDYKEVLRYGIGLTDLAKGVSGNDNELIKSSYDTESLKKKVLTYKPRVLCFNGKKAAQVYLSKEKINYGLQDNRIGTTLVYVAPFTSGSANGYWDETYYFDLAKLIKKI